MADSAPDPTTPREDESGAIWPWVGIVGLSAIGLALSLYLVEEHYLAWTDPSVKALCDINEALSCSVVARTPYAVFAGLPVAVWGVFGYVFIATVGFWGWFGRSSPAAVAALGALTGFATVTSLVLGILSKLAIGVLCPFCLGTYGVNGALAVLAVALFVKTGWRVAWVGAVALVRERRLRCGQIALASGVVVALTVWLYPRYWLAVDPIAEQIRTMPAAPPSASAGSTACNGDGTTTGVTADGHHWIGARDPKVTLTEFSDYQCPFCALAHRKLRTLIEAYPTVIRVIHRHFPLDQACNPIITEPFHPASCFYSGLAVCAGEQGKFWAANDYLYLHGREPKPIEVGGFSSELGLDRKALEKCLEEKAWTRIRPDLEEGIRLEIRGTPTFLVDGKVLVGADPADVLAPYLPDAAPLRATPTAPEPGPNAAAQEVAPDSSATAAPSIGKPTPPAAPIAGSAAPHVAPRSPTPTSTGPS